MAQAILDLFGSSEKSPNEPFLGNGTRLLRGFARGEERTLLDSIQDLLAQVPTRHFLTPFGKPMSVAMSNRGELGWVSSRSGYRYSPVDPSSNKPWPPMPGVFTSLARCAAAAAGYDRFEPEACLINHYVNSAKMNLHRDEDEEDLSAPIVSVSLGVSAVFLWGGLKRTDPTTRIELHSGDVLVWGGTSRLSYHGVGSLLPPTHPLTGAGRYNLTFRRVRR